MGSGRLANAGGGTGVCVERDPDEQVEYKIRPATPEKPSAEQQRANNWDEWLLTEQPLDEEATRKLARKYEPEKKEKAQREHDREQNRITKKQKGRIRPIHVRAPPPFHTHRTDMTHAPSASRSRSITVITCEE
jgi:hypothetical protein